MMTVITLYHYLLSAICIAICYLLSALSRYLLSSSAICHLLSAIWHLPSALSLLYLLSVSLSAICFICYLLSAICCFAAILRALANILLSQQSQQSAVC
jgi:hypothetical protein